MPCRLPDPLRQLMWVDGSMILSIHSFMLTINVECFSIWAQPKWYIGRVLSSLSYWCLLIGGFWISSVSHHMADAWHMSLIRVVCRRMIQGCRPFKWTAIWTVWLIGTTSSSSECLHQWIPVALDCWPQSWLIINGNGWNWVECAEIEYIFMCVSHPELEMSMRGLMGHAFWQSNASHYTKFLM